jgi:hypothetical protein
MTVELLAAARVISKPINDLYELGKDRFKSKLQRTKTNANINKIHKNISSIHKVKTIWQIDKAVSLKKFYYPSSLTIENIKTNINSINKIPADGNIVIQGIVGQGKSIFLRYLSYQEINIGSKIPIFFELRRIEKNDSLSVHIEKILDSYGFEPTPEIIDFLYSSGKLVLILDGFDEILQEKVKSTITELELLSEKYPNLKIVISSRPESGIENSPHFQVFNLSPLSPDELPLVLSKITDNKSQATEISKAVNSSETEIRSLLTTPLMITLLVMVYKSEQKIPEQLSEFYENLFALLLYRHDKSKPGYSRERATTLNERKLQQAFEAFCYITRRNGLSSISTEEMHEVAEEAFEAIQVTCDSSAFIKDITKVSNLIVEEGYKYHFIHKSVQEFHAANYIKSRPEEAAIKFYSAMISNYYYWRQEINFLQQIDAYRFIKYLFIPSTLEFLNTLEISTTTWTTLTHEQMNNILKKLYLQVPKTGKVGVSDISYYHGELASNYYVSSQASSLLHSLVLLEGQSFFEGNDPISLEMIKLARAVGVQMVEDDYTEYMNLSLYIYLKHKNLLPRAYEVINKHIEKIHKTFAERQRFILREENSLRI